MPLTPGTKLGPYEIVAAAGAGGMGEVYRARDTRLDRTVAIKVLPAHLSDHPERRQRFDREARAISSLNHPNICTLYDVGHQEGVDYLVMEYMEGESLADRLQRGPLPPEQLLKYGVEICEGLEQAHRSGVVHRDLKPGNIMLTRTGAKLMDFGLAKTANPEASASALTASLAGPGGKPLTAEGMVVGTFQYMAPEQLEGKEADARSDVFALGSVLYEMATGKRAFTGKSQASVVAAILASEPQPISALRPMSPPTLDRLVKVCLAKDPEERWQTAHDVKLQLKWIAEGGSEAGVPAPLAARRRHAQTLAWAVAAVCLLAALALGAAWLLRAPKPELPLQASLLPPKDSSFAAFNFAVSPDGRKLVFVARGASGGGNTLWVRPLDSIAAQPLAGTEDAQFPFWSPDSKSIGFFANHKLRRIDAAGGPVLALADAETPRGGSWSPDGTIVFAPASVGGLWQIPAAGGAPTQLTQPANPGAERSHRWPSFLPDGRHLLYYNSSPSGPLGRPAPAEVDAGSGIYVLDIKTGHQSLVVRAISQGQYASGYVFYLDQGNLMAQPFELSSLKAT
ncbi:MAG TPA: protein kinase, partial [Terriglobales bacterium]|nr:protein kinase [Terriglobales bacterium]